MTEGLVAEVEISVLELKKICKNQFAKLLFSYEDTKS